MTGRHGNPEVDPFFQTAKTWKAEYARLRAIILDRHLDEGLKWGKPCYTFEGRNIVLIHGFKDYCALLFFKGALLADPNGLLVRQTDNVQAARQIRFDQRRTDFSDGGRPQGHDRRGGRNRESRTESRIQAHDRLRCRRGIPARLAESPDLKAAFEALTPGRQRGYLLYFSAPKQSKTREARIEKSKAQILKGKGLDD